LPQHYLIDIHQSSIVNVVRRLGFKSTNEQQERVSTMDVDMGQGASSTVITATNENISVQIQEVYETINILAGGIQTLNDDTQRLSGESIRLQSSVESLTNEFTSLKLSTQEQSAFLDGIRPNQESLQQDVASLKQTVDDMQYVSYDGTLIWKITSFREKMCKIFLEKIVLLTEEKSVQHSHSFPTIPSHSHPFAPIPTCSVFACFPVKN
jgi:FtsZ-binding cell division protein ZapB